MTVVIPIWKLRNSRSDVYAQSHPLESARAGIQNHSDSSGRKRGKRGDRGCLSHTGLSQLHTSRQQPQTPRPLSSTVTAGKRGSKQVGTSSAIAGCPCQRPPRAQTESQVICFQEGNQKEVLTIQENVTGVSPGAGHFESFTWKLLYTHVRPNLKMSRCDKVASALLERFLFAHHEVPTVGATT